MREILFRGKRVDNDEWVYGGLFVENTRCEIVRGTCNSVGIEGVDVIPKTVGQYTGLTDKNGKKIFEGDYVINIIDEGSKEETVCVEYVGFYDGSFGFFDHIVGDSSPYPNDCFTPFEYCVLENIDFCGNIHDNPELLKGGDENA